MRSIGLINVMKEKLVILFLNIATALECAVRCIDGSELGASK